jgi:exodeoxyribonuclease V
MITLSEDQVAAVAAVDAALATGKAAAVFVGPAGSGKTVTTATIVAAQSSKRPVTLVCPTGKAASVLSNKSGQQVTTIHRALYGKVDDDGVAENGRAKLIFGKPHPPCAWGGLVICDEASMVGTSLGQDLEYWAGRAKGQVLYVGDREQLPPVNDQWAADFANPDAALTTIHRQAEGSAILMLATAIRQSKGFKGWRDDCRLDPSGDPVAWLTAHLRAGTDATLLCYTNAVRSATNAACRIALGRSGEPLVVGDLILCRANHAESGVMNGEVSRVMSVAGVGDQRRVTLDNGAEVRVNTRLIGKDYGAFKAWKKAFGRRGGQDCMHIDYGYCLTVHSSQGSQWENVGFVRDASFSRLKQADPDSARRLAYTAVTRASDNLVIFGV